MSENDVGDFYRSTAAREVILASKLKNLTLNLIKFYKFGLKFSPNLNR